MYLNGAGFMMRAGRQGIRARFADATWGIICREVGQVKSKTARRRANCVQTERNAAQLSIGLRKHCARLQWTHLPHFGYGIAKSISASGDPLVAPSPSEPMSQPASVRSIDVMSTEPASKRLVVEAKAISLTFETADGRVDALSNVSLQIAEGEFVSFIGPSGCGKTTMLRVIADLQQPTSGSLLVNGMTAENARLARSYGYVFQAPALFPWRTIEKNLKLPLEIMGFSESEQRIRAERYMAMVNLKGFERKFPWQLSGGMQQRVSIARALSFDPAMLLMDEPFGALDEIVRDHLNEQLLQLWKSTEKTVLFVTHSIPEAVFLSTKIVVMSPRPGRIIDIIDCDFPADRSLEIRETPEFLKIAQRVRNGLRAGHSYDE
jgi:NitT/TauT family transport system ATP-binding protein